MGAQEWIIALALEFVALPHGAVIRLTPNERCERVRPVPKPEDELMFTPDVESGFAFAVDRVRDNIGTFAKLHGGRMRGTSFVHKSRSAAPDPDGSHLV